MQDSGSYVNWKTYLGPFGESFLYELNKVSEKEVLDN